MSVRVAVVGHVEWVDFVPVPHLPRPGEVIHGRSPFAQPAGGGGVACGVLAEAGAEVELFTALGSGPNAEEATKMLRARGVTVHDAPREQPMRRAVTLLVSGGDRAIVTLGERIHPAGEDALPWERLSEHDGVYFTAGDAEALEHARRARVLVATPRAGAVLNDGPEIDALVYSADDPYESSLADAAGARARLLVATEGAAGGRWSGASSGRWAAAEVPGPVCDSYGCGDAFAAILACALGAGEPIESAVATSAEWGARMLTRTGGP